MDLPAKALLALLADQPNHIRRNSIDRGVQLLHVLALVELKHSGSQGKAHTPQRHQTSSTPHCCANVGKSMAVHLPKRNLAATDVSAAPEARRVRPIPVPRASLVYSDNCSGAAQSQSIQAKVWFPREPAYVELTEMSKIAGNYDYTLSLLLMPEAEWRQPQHDDGESEEDTFDRFINNGQFPDRK